MLLRRDDFTPDWESCSLCDLSITRHWRDGMDSAVHLAYSRGDRSIVLCPECYTTVGDDVHAKYRGSSHGGFFREVDREIERRVAARRAVPA